MPVGPGLRVRLHQRTAAALPTRQWVRRSPTRRPGRTETATVTVSSLSRVFAAQARQGPPPAPRRLPPLAAEPDPGPAAATEPESRGEHWHWAEPAARVSPLRRRPGAPRPSRLLPGASLSAAAAAGTRTHAGGPRTTASEWRRQYSGPLDPAALPSAQADSEGEKAAARSAASAAPPGSTSLPLPGGPAHGASGTVGGRLAPPGRGTAGPTARRGPSRVTSSTVGY